MYIPRGRCTWITAACGGDADRAPGSWLRTGLMSIWEANQQMGDFLSPSQIVTLKKYISKLFLKKIKITSFTPDSHPKHNGTC